MAAIVSNNPGVKPGSLRENIVTPYVEQPDHQSLVIDTKYEPMHNLIVHAEGYQWKITYYSQILGADSSTAGQNLGKSQAYQRYTRIIDLLVKVTSPISMNQESDSKSLNTTGEMILPPTLIPNAGDMFIADRGDGVLGIFEVRDSTKKSVFKDAVYSVTFNIVDEAVKANDPRIIDLDKKTSNKKVYSLDFLENGQNPLVDEKEVRVVRDMYIARREMLRRSLHKFYSDQFKVMLMPNQEGSVIYEPYVTKHVSRCYTEVDHADLAKLRVLNVSERPEMDFTSFWDALEQRNKVLLEDAFKGAINASVGVFSRIPTNASVRYSGCKFVVCPLGGEFTTDKETFGGVNNSVYTAYYGYTTIIPFAKDIIESNSDFKMTIEPQVFKAYKGRPLINQIFPNESYVMSKDFYQGLTDGMSHLEVLTYQYFRDEYLNQDVLMELVDDHTNWGVLEQFYYVPILLALLKYSIRTK